MAMGAWCQDSINDGGSSASLLNRKAAEAPEDYRGKSRRFGGAFLVGALALAALQQTMRAPLVEEALSADVVSMTLRVEDCKHLQCVARVTTKTPYEGARFLLAYWPTGLEDAVVYTEEQSLRTTNEVRLFRLQPGKTYEVVARVKPSADAAVATPVASQFDVPTTGVGKFDDSAIGGVTGDPTFELLLFPYMEDVTNFRGLVAMDKTGHAVWYRAGKG